MKTKLQGRCWLLEEPGGECIVFQGSAEELDKYRTWLSQANHIKKERYRIVSRDAWLIVPVKEEDDGT